METQPGNPDAMGVRLPADSHAQSNDPPGMTACSVAAAAWRGACTSMRRSRRLRQRMNPRSWVMPRSGVTGSSARRDRVPRGGVAGARLRFGGAASLIPATSTPGAEAPV